MLRVGGRVRGRRRHHGGARGGRQRERVEFPLGEGRERTGKSGRSETRGHRGGRLRARRAGRRDARRRRRERVARRSPPRSSHPRVEKAVDASPASPDSVREGKRKPNASSRARVPVHGREGPRVGSTRDCAPGGVFEATSFRFVGNLRRRAPRVLAEIVHHAVLDRVRRRAARGARRRVARVGHTPKLESQDHRRDATRGLQKRQAIHADRAATRRT